MGNQRFLMHYVRPDEIVGLQLGQQIFYGSHDRTKAKSRLRYRVAKGSTVQETAIASQ